MWMVQETRGPRPPQCTPPSPNCCCIRSDWTTKTFLLFPSSVFSPHFSSYHFSLMFFHVYANLFSISSFSLSIPLLLSSCFASFSPRLGITTRLSRGPWTCQSSGGSCKRRTQLTIPLQRRWCQTCASCSGTVLSSIMYVLPVLPLPYFPVTPRLSWLHGVSGLVLGCYKDLGVDPWGLL